MNLPGFLIQRIVSTRQIIPTQEAKSWCHRALYQSNFDQMINPTPIRDVNSSQLDFNLVDNNGVTQFLVIQQQNPEFIVSMVDTVIGMSFFYSSWCSFFPAVIIPTRMHSYVALRKLNIDKCFKDRKESCLELT